MSNGKPEQPFSGPYKGLLDDLSTLITWLNANHDLSFVQAGDNSVFAYGGNGYVVVFDESIWGGLIELVTPGCTFSIKAGDDSKITVASTNPDEKASKRSFKEALAAIRHYYENRYWKTPKTAES